ncbi:MAG: LON peptidase substrate-binding domain-containing protein [Humibacillus sp.]|nr:LON peptidase substrate-binding domain-containing protein [Humibacillus sp.]MDN5778913.1 LON peptidase substrate-binding domain-containing protein [Humibacillus sp.]
MASLPLFPLGTVLLPGARLPLQIFEPRYVAMLRDIVDGQGERPPVFGVLAIREGFEVGDDGVRALHQVGCAALLTQAASLGDERFLIVCEGTERFRLEGIENAGTDYFTGEVSWLDEVDGDRGALDDLAARLRREIAAFRRATAADDDDETPPDDNRELSYWLPNVVNLDLGERQQLLASDDTEARLRLSLRLVRRERALAEALGAVAPPPDRPMNLN